MAEIFSDLSLNNLSIEPSDNSNEALMINDIPLFKKVENDWKINNLFLNCNLRGNITKIIENENNELKEITLNYKTLSYDNEELIECSCTVYYTDNNTDFEYYVYCHDTFKFDLQKQNDLYFNLLNRLNIIDINKGTGNKVIIVPHYVGFGTSANLKRAYFMKYNSESILDALIATDNYFKNKKINISKNISIAGFSHGAYQSLYVHSLIDKHKKFTVKSNVVVGGIFDNSLFNLTNESFNAIEYENFDFYFIRLAWNSGISYSNFIDEKYKNNLTNVFKVSESITHDTLVNYFESNVENNIFNDTYKSLNDIFKDEFIQYVQGNTDLQEFISNQNIVDDLGISDKSTIKFVFGQSDNLAPYILSKNLIDKNFSESKLDNTRKMSHSELYKNLPSILDI